MAAQVEDRETDLLDMAKYYENYILIDIGANLTNKKYGRDLDSVVQRAKDSGVQKIMVTGTSVKGSKEALRLTRIYPNTLYSTAGIHPHDAKSYTEESWLELKQLASNSECVAIGECGLDYNRNFSDPEDQKTVFRKHIELAIETNKPLFVHERDAHEDLLKVLKEFHPNLPPVVIHCFTGTQEQALTYLDKGFYIGLTGYLCKDKSDVGVRKLLESGSLPLDRLVVETDAPFMYPNTRASKLPDNVKDSLTERVVCNFQENKVAWMYGDLLIDPISLDFSFTTGNIIIKPIEGVTNAYILLLPAKLTVENYIWTFNINISLPMNSNLNSVDDN